MQNILLFAMGIGAATLGQVLMKLASAKIPQTFSNPLQLLNPVLILAFAVYFFGAIVWLLILRKFPLSVAYQVLAINYISVAICSALIFHEPFTARKVLSYALILAGIVLLPHA
jgi:small multidrug resistance pump